MANLSKLPTWAGPELVHVVVETPRGARAKLNYDPKLKTFVLSKFLMLGLSYPFTTGALFPPSEPKMVIRSMPSSSTMLRHVPVS